MRSALVRLFNLILNSGIVPTEWCISLIQPLYKNKGSKLDANNYRGISLISCVGKVFTQLINRRLENFIHQNDILGQEQAGFRSFFSTSDHIFVLNIIIDLYLNKIKKKSKRLYCAFIDYEKAFDLIDRTLLFTKLISYNINGKLTKVIFSIYQNVKACLKLDNVISKSFLCNIGVRQGDSLSPLLFSLFLNDLNTFISGKYNGLSDISLLFSECFNMNVNDCLKLFVLLYADDTIILADTEKEMKSALKALEDYCKTWKLKVNINKSKIIRFSKRKSKNLPQFIFNNDIIDIVDDYVYLGTTITYNGKFKNAQNKQVIQAKRALASIKSKKEKLQLPFDIYMNLFYVIVLPVLLYGCEIWGYEDCEDVEIFFRYFLKNTLKLNRQTPSPMVYGESGKKPLTIKVQIRMINFWVRIVFGDDNKIVFKIYKLIRHLYDKYLA